MGEVKEYESEKLIMGILYCNESLAANIEKKLESIFGKIDLRSSIYNFSEISSYYDQEIGGVLKRHFLSFEHCINPSRLAEIKLLTNNLENEYLSDGCRKVNIDPGLISHGRLTLATTKNAAHRIPLYGGIYAEITLLYAQKEWQHFPWTYMDFKNDATKSFLYNARTIYLQQRKTVLQPCCNPDIQQ